MSDWRSELSSMFEKAEEESAAEKAKLAERRSEAADWISEVAAPALEEVKQELERHGREVTTTSGAEGASIQVHHKGQLELRYSIQFRIFPTMVHPYPELVSIDRKTGTRYKAEGFLRSGSQDTIKDFTKDDIIRHFLKEYRHHMIQT